jgi:hypothetical protein
MLVPNNTSRATTTCATDRLDRATRPATVGASGARHLFRLQSRRTSALTCFGLPLPTRSSTGAARKPAVARAISRRSSPAPGRGRWRACAWRDGVLVGRRSSGTYVSIAVEESDLDCSAGIWRRPSRAVYDLGRGSGYSRGFSNARLPEGAWAVRRSMCCGTASRTCPT